MTRASMMLRRLVSGRAAARVAGASSSVRENLMVSSVAAASYATAILSDENRLPLSVSQFAPVPATDLQLRFQRSFSISPSSDSSNVVVIESEEQFNDSLRKVKDESLPAVFYFTAVWCGPCKLLSPIVGQLSEKYPHVTTYKIDIDKEELGKALSLLNVTAVPTLHLFQNGKKAGEVIGADVQLLKDTMEKLYK